MAHRLPVRRRGTEFRGNARMRVETVRRVEAAPAPDTGSGGGDGTPGRVRGDEPGRPSRLTELTTGEGHMKTALGMLAGMLLSIPGGALAGAKVEIGEDRYFTLGAGTRVSFTALEDAAA